MNEEKKLNAEALDQVTGGGEVNPIVIPSEAEMGAWSSDVAKTCAGCKTNPCPHNHDMRVIYYAYMGGSCPYNA